jgi:ATP-dependent helicase HrpA
LMRHEAAGITTATFPKTIRLGGIDCEASYLHEPGDAKDGVTVTVPIYALNQVSEERCEWLVPGMLKDKVLGLLKTLHQRPRSRLVPLPAYADEFVAGTPFAQGALLDVLLKAVRERTQLAVQRNDFKLEQLQPHLFMNFRIVDEHGRQLGTGRNLASLKAELGGLARSAFQALAALRLPAAASTQAAPAAIEAPTRGVKAALAPRAPAPAESPRYTTWSFAELPELMEIRRGAQTMVGFPALVDRGDGVEIEVFDEPEAAAAKHRAGLRRLVALQIKEPLKYLEKNIPELQKMATAYMSLGTLEELREQIIALAVDRAFLAEPLPTDEAGFNRRIEEGRSRLTLIAQEVARLAGQLLTEYAAAQRKLKDNRPPKEVADDIQAQLQRLMPKRFMLGAPYAQLQHEVRYLKAVTLRLDKLKADPARDVARLDELRPLEQRWLRRLSELKGAGDARLDEYRWLLEELRVSLFAQELRTPQPVSAKRLDKLWSQLSS